MISVRGSASVSGTPDVMRLHLAAGVVRPTVAEAIADSEQAVVAIRGSLTAAGVDRRDAATAGLSVTAEQVWSEQHGPRVSGYRSEHRLAVTLRDLTTAGRVLGEALAAGGDAARLDQLVFEIEDDAALRDAARAAAWQDALHRGEQLAALSGRALGAVHQVEEEDLADGPVPRMAMRRQAAAEASEIGVQPGSVAVRVTLAVRWELS